MPIIGRAKKIANISKCGIILLFNFRRHPLVKPISSNVKTPSIHLTPFSVQRYREHASCLSSMQEKQTCSWIKNGWGYISSLFWLSVDFFNWLCCCKWISEKQDHSKTQTIKPAPLPKKPSPPPQQPTETSSSDETSPSEEKSFYTLMCNENETPEKYSAVVELFKSLGTSTFLWWIWDRKKLHNLGERVKALGPHPLGFLYSIFLNKEHTKWIVEFKNQATRGNSILARKTKRNPWEEFLVNQAKNFQKHKDNLSPYLEGFCEELNLELTEITILINKALEQNDVENAKKQWQQLVLFILETRKKHFNIS